MSSIRSGTPSLNGDENLLSASECDGEDDLKFDVRSWASLAEFDRSESGDGGLDTVIKVVNRLQDVINHLGLHKIKLPQIVVCGSQSSGKTSVLESVAGEELLPRGTGIQTRCPIILQLVNVKLKPKWVEFLHEPGKRYTNMEDVKAAVEKISNNIKDNGYVSATPITLKLFSPTVPNLTLVDLPGLVETAVEGQPETIVDKINEVVLSYISNESSIILGVSAAHNDIADSKAIKLARQVDPDGKRTLGVLTKLDMMDEGTNANDVLQGKTISLKKGIIGVVNRNYLEMKEKKSFEAQLKKEKLFLQAHYPMLASKNGTLYLIKRISEELMQSIKTNLPGIKDSVNQSVEDLKDELEQIGEPKEKEPNHKVLLKLLTKFAEAYIAQVDGRKRNLNLTNLNAAARIKKLFDVYLGEEIEKLMAATNLTDNEIDVAIQNSLAIHSRYIDYDDAFQELAKREVKKLYPAVQTCTKEVCKEMKNAIDTSLEPVTKYQYPKLFRAIKDVSLELIDEKYKECQIYLEKFVDAEASIARTINGGFRDKSTSYQQKGNMDAMKGAKASTGNADPNAPNNEEMFENANIHRANVKRDVMLYFEEAKMQITEHVARGIVKHLVYGISDDLRDHLLERLHKAEIADELLKEGYEDDTLQRRKIVEEKLKDYEEAKNVVDRIDVIINNNQGKF